MIRPARLSDLTALLAIENRCFQTDRLSRRNFRYPLTQAKAATLLLEADGAVQGYVMLLFNQGTSLARLYSVAVDPALRGQGAGRQLIEAAEACALAHECLTLRLEVRADNPPAIALYRRLGYHQFGIYEDYYDDHARALRFEKRLAPELNVELAAVPYYRQTLDFTCGPSALMMAMKTLQPELPLDRRLELNLWRESTTIFMTSGHGGCSPYGLALAAHHRGFDVEIHVKDDAALFVDSVRDPEKKAVIRLVQEAFIAELSQLPIPIHYGVVTIEELEAARRRGGVPVVLISSYRIYGEKFPHWVVVTGFDERCIYVHDPYLDENSDRVIMDCINMPILRRDFARMNRYGKAAQMATLVVYPRPHGGAIEGKPSATP